jgi:hypothetical protein
MGLQGCWLLPVNFYHTAQRNNPEDSYLQPNIFYSTTLLQLQKRMASD